MPLTIPKEKLAAPRWKRVAIVARISTALRWLPILVGVGISTATLFVWQALIDQERTHIEQMIQLESSNVNNVVAAQLKSRINALQRMANRWEIRGGTPKREWEFDAQSDVSDEKGFQAIEWADPSFHIRWIVPLAGNEAAQNLNVAGEPRRRIAMDAARNRHQVTATRSISLVQGGKGFLAYVPIFQGEDFRGFIVGVFRYRRLLNTILQGEENLRRGYSITVFDGEEEIYSRNVVTRQHSQEWGQETTINLYGVTWRVRVWPQPELLTLAQSPLPQVVLVGGLLMAWLLALTVHLAQKTLNKKQQESVTNKELEREIAERKRIEAALLESDERFKAFMNNSPAVAFMKDEQGRFVYLNEPFERCLNIRMTDWLGKTDFDVWPEELAQQFRENDRAVFAAGKTLELVETVPTPDGCLRHWLSFKFPFHDISGQQLLGGVAIDITQRQQVEEEVREMSIALENAVEGIAQLDTQGRYISVNKAYASMVGYTPEEMIGMEWQPTVHPEELENVMTAYQYMLTNGKVQVTARGLRKDGSVFFKELMMVSAYDKQQKFIGHYCFMKDITERKQSEAALFQANEKLTGWVNELEQRNREIALLGQMSDILQACLTVTEAYSVLPSLIQPLFPEAKGGIFLITASNNLVEAVASWGSPPLSSQEMFTPDQCWALRRGREHRVSDTHRGLVCKHIHQDSSPAESLCVPMMAQGESLGVLYLSSQTLGQLTETKQHLASAVAEHIALSLANLKLRETLQKQSIRDPLTGLFNRRYLEESLEREVHRCERKQLSLGIIMLDVDHFKRFNDTFGHEAGDFMLQELGQFLLRNIRGSDIACRYGGEELTLILPEACLDVTRSRAELLRQGANHLNVQHRHQMLGRISLSLGVACFPEHGLTGKEVLRAADAALYQAKKEGRDRVTIATVESIRL